jgi:hypothetical protein
MIKGEALEEALDDTSELEDTVRELIEGKNAVTGKEHTIITTSIIYHK